MNNNLFLNYNCDDRSKFANLILSNSFKLHNCEFSEDFLSDLKKIRNWLDEYVRNIYEVIDDEIPLLAYYQVKKYGSSGFCAWEEYETNDALELIAKYCKEIYNVI